MNLDNLQACGTILASVFGGLVLIHWIGGKIERHYQQKRAASVKKLKERVCWGSPECEMCGSRDRVLHLANDGRICDPCQEQIKAAMGHWRVGA